MSVKIRRILGNQPHPWKSVFKKEFLILFFVLFFENGFAQWEKFAFSAEASPMLIHIYDQYDNVHYYNDFNYLLGLEASAFVIDRKIDLAVNTGLFLKTKNYHSEDWSMKIQWPEEPIKTEQKYTYLSVPLTLKCELETGKNYLAYVEGGILFNWIVAKHFHYESPDGVVIDQFPSDAGFQYINDLYFAAGFGRNLKASKSLIGIKPYLLYKYKLESYYSHGLYNLGRLGFGVSLYYSFYIRRNPNEHPR